MNMSRKQRKIGFLIFVGGLVLTIITRIVRELRYNREDSED